jgi:AcrR family transcriptional regulator
VFAEVGMDAASVEMICERAGFTRGAFYSNFESKNELFLALITQLAEAKLDEVAGRVRELPVDAIDDTSGSCVRWSVRRSVSAWSRSCSARSARRRCATRAGERLPRWQDAMAARVEGIISYVVDAYDLSLRLPVAEAARLLVDVSTTRARARPSRAPGRRGERTHERPTRAAGRRARGVSRLNSRPAAAGETSLQPPQPPFLPLGRRGVAGQQPGIHVDPTDRQRAAARTAARASAARSDAVPRPQS